MKSAPKFKKGQVVKIVTDWYRKERKAQQYQLITFVFPWKKRSGKVDGGYGLEFVNGDQCHEKFVRALTTKEIGSASAKAKIPKPKNPDILRPCGQSSTAE